MAPTKKRKKDERNVIKLIRKSNELVEARYKFDIWETRVFTKMLTMVRSDDKDFKTYRIYLKDIVREFRIENNKDAYQRLRGGAFKLMSKIVRVVRQTDEGLMELNTPIVVGVENLLDQTNEDAKFIDVSFHPKMKPFLLSLRSHFTTYDVRNILKLPSSYSIRIYELLKQYQKIGRRKITVQELKEIIGVIEEMDIKGKKSFKDNYPLYGNFKQRVLLKAQKDLTNYTDISFTFEQIKRGRSVYEILFFISPNVPKKADERRKKQEKTLIVNELTKELHARVGEWVSLKIVQKWLTKYPEAQVRKGIEYTLAQLQKGKEIQNVGGYLQEMVKQEVLIDGDEIKRKNALEKKQAIRAKKQRKAELEEALKMLYSELTQQEFRLIDAFLIEEPSMRSKVVEQMQQSRLSHYDISRSLEENLENPIAKASFRNTVHKLLPSIFEELHKEYQPRIQQLKRMISDL